MNKLLTVLALLIFFGCESAVEKLLGTRYTVKFEVTGTLEQNVVYVNLTTPNIDGPRDEYDFPNVPVPWSEEFEGGGANNVAYLNVLTMDYFETLNMIIYLDGGGLIGGDDTLDIITATEVDSNTYFQLHGNILDMSGG